MTEDIIKAMANKLNYDCKKVIYGKVIEHKRAEFAAKKIQNWWRQATGYRIILNKIWDAYQNDDFEALDCLNLDLKFLRFVGNDLSVLNIYSFMYEEAVQWYLKYRRPCVFCKEFIDIFYDVEEEEEDYDYRDWKTSGKWLIFASYINSCGGLDEWNWLQVFSGIMLDEGNEDGERRDGEEKENNWDVLICEAGGLFSCDTWLSSELKKHEFRGFSRRQIIFMSNGVSPTLELLKGQHEDICTKNYFLLEKVLKSGKDMDFCELQRLLDYFVIAPNVEDIAWVKGNIENWRVFEQHLIEELCGLVSSSLAEDFRHRLAVKLLEIMFKLSNKLEEYRFTWLICGAIMDGRFAKNTLYEDVLMFNGDTRLSVNILKCLGVLRFEI